MFQCLLFPHLSDGLSASERLLKSLFGSHQPHSRKQISFSRSLAICYWCFLSYISGDRSSLIVHNVSKHKREIWTQEVLLKVVVETVSSGKHNCFSFHLKCQDLKAFLLAEIGGWAVVSFNCTQMQLNTPRWNLKYSIAASWAASALTATGEGCKGSHLVIHQHFYTLSSAACLEGRCATFLKIQLDESSQFSFILSVAEPSKAFFLD